ncbi:MAG: chitobiase/beta-hexosaminidase C-terminal domain-containing protein [Acidobacteriaceae bacterium]
MYQFGLVVVFAIGLALLVPRLSVFARFPSSRTLAGVAAILTLGVLLGVCFPVLRQQRGWRFGAATLIGRDPSLRDMARGTPSVPDLKAGAAAGGPSVFASPVGPATAAMILASYSPAAGEVDRPRGPVVNLNPGMTTEVLQRAISRAPNGATIFFAPGTYSINKGINVPCANALTLTGPAANPATAILAATFNKGNIFYMDGCAGIIIQFLHFENAGAVYMGKSANSGLTFVHNQITNLQDSTGVWIDGWLDDKLVNGTLQNLVSNTTIEHNTIGDAGSCQAEFARRDVNDYECAGIVTHAGELLNLRIKYNSIVHVTEGIHLQQLTTYKPGGTSASCDSCRIEYNYIFNYHRIGFENQIGAPNNPIYVQHNVVNEPINAFYGTFAMSMACCLSGFIQNGNTGFSPSLYYNDNVTISTGAGGGSHPPYGIEFWGTGAQGLKSLVQGNFSNGYTYGFGVAPWAIRDNYICGPYLVKEGGYISDQQKQPPPAMSGNITTPTCKATASAAPKIAPAPGSYSAPTTVSLDTGAENTSIYYTTDGTTPVPGAGTTRFYDRPIIIDRSMTLKAVGMWGAPNQPLSYPSGYGYVPSNVVTASFVINSSGQKPGI